MTRSRANPLGRGREWLGASLLAAASVLLPGAGAAQAGGASLVLICVVDGQTGVLASDFETAFCAELDRYLQEDLNLRVSSAPDATGRALELRVHVRSAHAADVELRSGRREGGTFTGGQPVSQRLQSMDRELTAFSARTLVRPIGLLLGLI